MIAGCPAGVYRVDAEQRDRIVAHKGLPASCPVVVLDGTTTANREGFFTEIARELYFPDYFGRNWDAVYDCLTDPGVLPSGGAAIVFDGFERFVEAEPDQWRIALKVFQDACAIWRPLDRPLYVLLKSSGEPLAGIPPLPRECLDSAVREEGAGPI